MQHEMRPSRISTSGSAPVSTTAASGASTRAFAFLPRRNFSMAFGVFSRVRKPYTVSSIRMTGASAQQPMQATFSMVKRPLGSVSAPSSMAR